MMFDVCDDDNGDFVYLEDLEAVVEAVEAEVEAVEAEVEAVEAVEAVDRSRRQQGNRSRLQS